MIKVGGKNLTVSLASVVALGVIAAVILFLNACGARHEEIATADNPANVNTSPAALPSVTQVVTPAMSPTPTNAGPNTSTEKTVVEKPRLVPPDSQGQQNSGGQQNRSPQSTPTPTLTQTLPGTGTGSGTGPGEGGGTGTNPRNPGRSNPGNTDYSRVFNGKEVDQKARILDKPDPGYTEAALKNDINGAVVLGAVFAASGQVIDIKVINGLPDGLNENAIAAAKRIKFTPALKDGRPVSMYVQVIYNFNLY